MAKRDSELLRALLGENENGAEDRRRPRPHPDAQVMTLRELCAAYVAGCQFAVGDLVTPRPGLDMRGAGDPHIVVEVADEPHRPFDPADGSRGSNGYGRRFDIRVIALGSDNETMVAHWGESWQFEPYREEPA